MESQVKSVFQVDSTVVQSARSSDNYRIEYTESNESQPNVCAVYFSSNYIYFPNNQNSFDEAILKKDRYEWWNLRHPRATKHIFIRDIYKQWYLHGINKNIDSIEKMKNFLHEELVGYEGIFIGSSAGGYAAILLGSLLNVKQIYSFNNQFFLTDLLEKSSPMIDPIIFREKDNPLISKYYNIRDYIQNANNVLYFHSNKSDWDIKQFKAVKDLPLNVISVNTNIHGIPLLKNNLVPLFKLSQLELLCLTKRQLNPLLFSIKIVGVYKTVIFLVQLTPNAYNRFIRNPLINQLKKMKK